MIIKDWKTTLSGILAAIGILLPTFGIDPAISQAVTAAGLALVGVSAVDGKKDE